jgi:Yip1 domain
MTPESSNESAPPMSEVGRITNVFLDPKKAFADIAARPRWIVPVVLVAVGYLAFMYCFTTHVGWEHSLRQTMENNSRMQQMDPQQRESIIQQQIKFAPIGAFIGGPIVIVVIALATAGVLLLVCKMMGASLSFKQMFGISAYAMLPGVVSSILIIIVIFIKNPEDFNLQNPLAFNLGAFLDPPPISAKALYSVATSIDLFSFWNILLLAVGISVAAPKFSFSKALVAVVVPWVVLVLVKAGWASLFG